MLKKILAVLVMLYAAVAFAATDVNKATAAELDAIKGIGPGISSKIIDERKKGNFKDWQDFIDRVKGVGETNAAKFSAEGMTVNGSSFKGVAAAPAAAAKKEEKKEEKAAAKADDKKPAASAAAKEEKKDAKADAKAEAKATKEAEKKAKEDAKAAKKGDAAKPAASAAKPAASAASAKK